MTKTTYAALKFVTPPSNQGQIVEVSYAIDADREEIVSRSYDASDNSTSYAVTSLDNLVGEFEPQNSAPRLADDGLWETVDANDGNGDSAAHDLSTLHDSDTTDPLTAEDLWITEEQCAAALTESADAGDTGHIQVNGRRVYAQ